MLSFKQFSDLRITDVQFDEQKSIWYFKYKSDVKYDYMKYENKSENNVRKERANYIIFLHKQYKKYQQMELSKQYNR